MRTCSTATARILSVAVNTTAMPASRLSEGLLVIAIPLARRCLVPTSEIPQTDADANIWNLREQAPYRSEREPDRIRDAYNGPAWSPAWVVSQLLGSIFICCVTSVTKGTAPLGGNQPQRWRSATNYWSRTTLDRLPELLRNAPWCTYHQRRARQLNVRFGSKADTARAQPNVRFTPKSGHRSDHERFDQRIGA